MKYKEFNYWCNQRAADGCWGFKEAITCVEACSVFSNIPRWKREKAWKEYEHRGSLEQIVTETDKIIKMMNNKDTVF